MDVLPLPPRPSIEQYRKRAKDLVRAAQSADDGAIRAWATAWLSALAKLGEQPPSDFVQGSIDRAAAEIRRRVVEKREKGDELGLADAQFLIARAHGFASWAAFNEHLTGLQLSNSAAQEFEGAADAVIAGDLATLDRMLRENPLLVHAHSPRVHHCTLLHYVAANGVEDFRQKSPPNAVAIATRLLDAGAKPDAIADTYSGDSWQTTLNLLVSSVHPHAAGVQVALVDTLVDYGAAVDGVKGDSSPLMTALAFNYPRAAEALARRGARVDAVITAAALGMTDVVDRMVLEGGTLRPEVPLNAPSWLHVGNDPKAHVALALVWGCKFDRASVVTLLLAKGVNPRVADHDRMTALHWGAATGSIEIIDMLLEHDVDLETRNRWGGTVLDSTVFFAVHAPQQGVDYLPVLERLIAHGANVHAVEPLPTGDARIDALLVRHGVKMP